MVFILAVRPRLLYIANRQIQSNKRLISSSTQKLLQSSNTLSNASKVNRQVTEKTNKFFKKRHVALVSGIIIIGSYISFNQSNYYNLDTVPPIGGGGRSGISPKLFPPSNTTVIGDDSRYFSTSTNSMHQKNSIGNQQQKQGVFLLNDEQVSERLRQFEESYSVNRGKGVTRYDICQLPSNSPIEDDRAEEIVQVPILQDNNIKTSTDWMFFGVFDGHGGWTTSSKLRDQLISYIVHELGTIFKPTNEDNLRYVPNGATIDQAIKNGFLKLDHEVVNKNMEKLLNDNNKAKAAELLMPALSGSCALLSFYDTNSKLLKVAVTGDSRALLGSFKDNHWTVRQLSIDQTGSNPTEVARIISEHPDEPNVVRNGRVLGTLEPTRAFGDCRYKLPASIQERIYKQFFGRRLPNNLKSPPYVTAEPVITTTKINPENNDFLVMASDGLYEMLSNEEIIGLVVKWMEKERMVKPQKSFWNYFGSTENKLPEISDITNDKSSKQPFRKNKQSSGYGGFLLDDRNVSTHLIRNALSNGGSREQTSMLISIPNPVSRRYRDDLTVTVVFFGKDLRGENEAGKLEINADATAGGIDSAKPKL
ncbi:DEHA2A11220p [Debaryomyces hansenii CBS767]|uniref:DEHA2A11220p n=1 Tax=Debaryomyces hansenii (strain ATCC 36239 / CBS 767 / BCRC 21394 / JCM 1990 / NBRC 0083 / IGC 2968) TaxID=284592 RepID=Q6BY99_DEBHA|nr:DEHA2A11220p [Debaryomyces hansenii CBS767]CAG84795.1 DEHA2A11220p [Debaryomyces hansenii CBS767]|eukprot:XP_456820.1 DEHA2A11220p [Debaryomyces hansenii CBS767]